MRWNYTDSDFFEQCSIFEMRANQNFPCRKVCEEVLVKQPSVYPVLLSHKQPSRNRSWGPPPTMMTVRHRRHEGRRRQRGGHWGGDGDDEVLRLTLLLLHRYRCKVNTISSRGMTFLDTNCWLLSKFQKINICEITPCEKNVNHLFLCVYSSSLDNCCLSDEQMTEQLLNS